MSDREDFGVPPKTDKRVWPRKEVLLATFFADDPFDLYEMQLPGEASIYALKQRGQRVTFSKELAACVLALISNLPEKP